VLQLAHGSSGLVTDASCTLPSENAAHRLARWVVFLVAYAPQMAFDSVAVAFSAADVALDRARRDLRHLDGLTFALPSADVARDRFPEVSHAYANWLVWARMVGVAIDGAGRTAGKPDAFRQWWDGIAGNAVHTFFRASRNAALKQVADLVADTPLRLDTDLTVAFFAFDRGPFENEPLVPRCQQYTDWLYDACSVPAREHLWDWERGRFLDGSDPGGSRRPRPAHSLA
jgi:hypothetical protein